MDRLSLRSTNLVSIGWEADEDSSSGTLEVEFKAGIVYQYENVPEWVYRGLLLAPSPGRYFRESVLENYDGERIA